MQLSSSVAMLKISNNPFSTIACSNNTSSNSQTYAQDTNFGTKFSMPSEIQSVYLDAIKKEITTVVAIFIKNLQKLAKKIAFIYKSVEAIIKKLSDNKYEDYFFTQIKNYEDNEIKQDIPKSVNPPQEYIKSEDSETFFLDSIQPNYSPWTFMNGKNFFIHNQPEILLERVRLATVKNAI